MAHHTSWAQPSYIIGTAIGAQTPKYFFELPKMSNVTVLL